MTSTERLPEQLPGADATAERADAPAFEGSREAPTAPPPLRPLELARWAWRQLTSMRVALVLLFLLALGAVPGSVLPQRSQSPEAVQRLLEERPTLGGWYDRLGLFDVYASPWFAAIYLLLFVSLVGCILPRSRQHWRAARMRPPRAPRHLDRLPASRRAEVDASPAEVLDRAAALLRRRRRYRVVVDGTEDVGGAVAAERGHLRETGNLVFHLALVVILTAVALGGLWGYRAQVLVVQGSSFANSVIQYDSLSGGTRFDAGSLVPFTLAVDRFDMAFRDEEGPTFGQPERYVAHVTVTDEPGAEPRQATISVNDPLRVEGTLVHILNPGYAPVITVRDAAGEVLFSDAVPFLPQDAEFTSAGVAKVPVPDGPDLAIEGLFLPTGVIDELGPRSLFAGLRDPSLVVTAWSGDLGLDSGRPQSVYRLDTTAMTQLTEGGEPFRAALRIGDAVELPGGTGSVTLEDVEPWVNLQVSRSPSSGWALAGALLAIAGLLASLFVRRRRLWVRASAGEDGRTVVEVAGLDRADGGDLGAEVDRVLAELVAPAAARPADADPDPPDHDPHVADSRVADPASARPSGGRP